METYLELIRNELKRIGLLYDVEIRKSLFYITLEVEDSIQYFPVDPEITLENLKGIKRNNDPFPAFAITGNIGIDWL